MTTLPPPQPSRGRDDPQGPPWMGEASAAFAAAMYGELQDAADILESMVNRHGPGVVVDAMIAWINTALRHAGVRRNGPGENRVHVMGFVQLDGDRTRRSVDEVPAEIAWAGRLMNARANNDREMFMALIDAVPEDPQVWGHHVLVLLSCCAQTTRGHHQFPDN